MPNDDPKSRLPKPVKTHVKECKSKQAGGENV